MENNNTVKVKVNVILDNPEDYFNDMIEDGVSVRDALFTIIEDELLHVKVQEMFPGMLAGDREDLGNGVHEVVLESPPVDMLGELI